MNWSRLPLAIAAGFGQLMPSRRGHFEREGRRMLWLGLIPIGGIVLTIVTPAIRRFFGW